MWGYFVQPILWYPSDAAQDAAYTMGVDSAFGAVQAWFQRRLGRSFHLKPTAAFTGDKTEAQISPLDLIPQYVSLANKCGGINNPYRLFYLIVVNQTVPWGGTYGGASFPKTWPPDATGNCAFPYPGRCFMSRDGPRILSHLPPRSDAPSYQLTYLAQLGGIAHEITHALGEPNHPQGWPEGDIMYSWWSWPNVDFNATTRSLILHSPFLS